VTALIAKPIKVLNGPISDPITSQGSNNASKAAAYLKSILDRGNEPFDPEWMQASGSS